MSDARALAPNDETLIRRWLEFARLKRLPLSGYKFVSGTSDTGRARITANTGTLLLLLFFATLLPLTPLFHVQGK